MPLQRSTDRMRGALSDESMKCVEGKARHTVRTQLRRKGEEKRREKTCEKNVSRQREGRERI